MDVPISEDHDRALVRPAYAPTLRIDNIRLEAPPSDAPKPSTLLKFDMLNDGASSVTDISIQIAILRKSEDTSLPRVIVRPFTIRGHATIEAGYTVSYQMLLRNLASDCGCVADIQVTSARVVSGPGS